jgi:alkaline phosphatase D
LEDVELHLEIQPDPEGTFTLHLYALRFTTGEVLAETLRTGVPDAEFVGGISLVSSNDRGVKGARYWFRELRTSVGDKVSSRPERAEGPILGVLYSRTGSVLKLNAHFLPIGGTEPQIAGLDVRLSGEGWTPGPTATIGSGYVAAFRVESWDASRDWEFRVVYKRGAVDEFTFTGAISRDPAGEPTLVVGLVNCLVPAHRSLDRASSGAPKIAGEHPLGLYTPDNVYFPHAALAANLAAQQPHLLVFSGDQLYENKPTAPGAGSAPLLDFLYKWHLWLWAFRDLTRRLPAVVQVDDHDLFQGNLWGHEGDPAPSGDALQGGYVRSPSFVNTIQRVQCSHNPDPYDPAPVHQDIAVYYSRFDFGGVQFALLEDRKFKGGDADGLDRTGQTYPAPTTQLLGPRQEDCLRAWGADSDPAPRICLTQTVLACVQTTESGNPKRDYDSNGYPPAGRQIAVGLLKAARALVVSGDQHLGSLVRHGQAGFTDGPVQFTPPAAGVSFQRWFEPATSLPNAIEGLPCTGDFTDAFGNSLRVLAVVNPVVSFTDFRRAYKSGQALGDRGLKREGYGVVRVDRAEQRFVLECWPWHVDPAAPGAQQFKGFPFVLPFSEV